MCKLFCVTPSWGPHPHDPKLAVRYNLIEFFFKALGNIETTGNLLLTRIILDPGQNLQYFDLRIKLNRQKLFFFLPLFK